jgi:hypothetical protein
MLTTRSVRKREDNDAAVAKLICSPLCRTELMSYVISKFLDISDIGALDSAMTNKTLRPAWLESLRVSSGEFTFDKYQHNERSLRWIFNRQIRMSILSYDRRYQKMGTELPSDYNLPSLVDLRPLYLKGATADEQITILTSGSPNLTSLELISAHDLSIPQPEVILHHCDWVGSVR